MAKATAKKKPEADTLRAKFNQLQHTLKSSLIERDDEVDAALVALLCREHLLLVGPPGTAKSMLLDGLVASLGGNNFTVLFNKFTTPDEVFGPVSVKGLTEDRYERITTGKLPEATNFFADEIFKASSAILNTLLRILNERVYDNGDGVLKPVPLALCVAASNEWPGGDDGTGKELGALFDRFLVRMSVRPIKSRDSRDRLWWSEDADLRPHDPPSISPAELQTAQEQVKQVKFDPDAVNGYHELMDALAQEGIRPGDRRQRKSVNAVRAVAWLEGRPEATRNDFGILQHTLWDDPAEQPGKVVGVVTKVMNPEKAKVNQYLADMEGVLRSAVSRADKTIKLRQLLQAVGQMRPTPDVDKARKILENNIDVLYNQEIGRKATEEEKWRHGQFPGVMNSWGPIGGK